MGPSAPALACEMVPAPGKPNRPASTAAIQLFIARHRRVESGVAARASIERDGPLPWTCPAAGERSGSHATAAASAGRGAAAATLGASDCAAAGSGPATAAAAAAAAGSPRRPCSPSPLPAPRRRRHSGASEWGWMRARAARATGSCPCAGPADGSMTTAYRRKPRRRRQSWSWQHDAVAARPARSPRSPRGAAGCACSRRERSARGGVRRARAPLASPCPGAIGGAERSRPSTARPTTLPFAANSRACVSAGDAGRACARVRCRPWAHFARSPPSTQHGPCLSVSP